MGVRWNKPRSTVKFWYNEIAYIKFLISWTLESVQIVQIELSSDKMNKLCDSLYSNFTKFQQNIPLSLYNGEEVKGSQGHVREFVMTLHTTQCERIKIMVQEERRGNMAEIHKYDIIASRADWSNPNSIWLKVRRRSHPSFMNFRRTNYWSIDIIVDHGQ